MAASRQVSLRISGQELDWRVTADHRRLRQVLINLLSNAIKYNRVGGQVSLAISHEPGSAADGPASGAGWVCLAVSDTGQGLTQRQINSLYQPFNRLGAELSEVEGSGLGLSLARELTEAMGGRLKVRSEPGKGSVFTLWLPAVQDGAVFSGVAARTGRQATDAAGDEVLGDRALALGPVLSDFNVLYVEDNRLNVLVMRHALKRLEGIRLEVATDGGSGLALAQQLRPDLLLIDLNLPVLNGTELMRRLRADPALAGTPCVAVSANSMPTDIELALAAGFDDYITKPFAVNRVLDVVQRLRREAGMQRSGLQAELFDSVQ
jgi:CheY-like chemotaxis protein